MFLTTVGPGGAEERSAAGGRRQWRRAVSGVVGAAVLALLATMVTATPASAVDPIDLTNIPRQNPDQVVQYPKSAAWDPLEVEARATVAQMHGVPNDVRIRRWAKEEVRATMFARLQQIAKDGAAATDEEKAALARLAELVKALKLDTANKAKELYIKWKQSPCTFVPPAGFTFDANDSLCATPVGSWFSNPTPPSAVEFQAYAASMVLGTKFSDADTQRVLQEMGKGIGMVSAVAASALGAAVSLAVVPEIASFSAIFPHAFVSNFAAGGLTSGGYGGIVSAGAVSAIVGVIIVFLAVTITAIINLVTEAQVPIDLDDAITKANETPDIAAIVNWTDPTSGTDEEKAKKRADHAGDVAALMAAFVGETLPDYYGQSIYGVAPVGDFVPDVDPAWTIDQTTKSPTMVVKVWDDPEELWKWHWESVYVHDKWLVRQKFGGPKFYSLSLPYFDWAGKPRLAFIKDGNSFYDRELKDTSGFTSLPTNCQGLEGCNLVERLNLQLQNPTTLVEQNSTSGFNRRPVIDPFTFQPGEPGAGLGTEGGDFTPPAQAVTEPDGDPMTVTWEVSKPAAQGGGAYQTYSGRTPTMHFTQDGDYPVKITAADNGGMTRTVSSTIHVYNANPVISDYVLSPPGDLSYVTIDEGGRAFVSGTVSDVGDDPLDLTVDWGDGSPTETVSWECQVVGYDPCAGVDGKPFVLSHVYRDDKPGFNNDPWYVNVTVRDRDGGSTGYGNAVFVDNVAPTVTLNARATGSPFQIPAGDVRVVPPGGTVEVSALIDDPGADGGTLIVDWGDGTTTPYQYPCDGTNGCTAEGVLIACGNQDPATCPGARVKVTHAYTGAAGGSELPITVRAMDDDAGWSATVPATAYIRAASQTLTFDPLPDVPLTTPSFPLTASSQSGLPVTFVASGACTVAGGVVSLTTAGTCTVVASQAGTLAWPSASVSRSFLVTTPLMVVAPSKQVVVGQAVGDLTATVSGLLNGDDIDDLVTAPTCTTTATSTSPPGLYPVTCTGGAGAPYYLFGSYLPGTVKVVKAPTSTAVSIDDSGHPSATVSVVSPGAGKPSGTVTFSRNGDVLGVVPVGDDGTANLSDPLPLGPVTVSALYSGDGSFLGSAGDAGATVTTPLTVTAPSRSVVVGQPVGTLTPAYTGFRPGDGPGDLTAAPTCTTTATTTSPPGTYPVTCGGTQAPEVYAVTHVPGSVVVAKAATTTTVSLGEDGIATAQVLVVAPGAGEPTGTVAFTRGGSSLGSAPLEADGTATLPVPLADGAAVVAATYSGDGSFTSSAGSTARLDPTISAAVVPTPGDAANRAGWYRRAVSVVFSCAAGSAPLTTPCPDPVVVGDGRGRVVQRTIKAADGGIATVAVSGLKVDSRAPGIRVLGLREGARYGGQPVGVSCAAVDALSGPASCRVTRELVRPATSPSYQAVWRFVAVATDVAGNRAQRTGTYTLLPAWIAGAGRQRNGSFRIRAGQYYVLQSVVGGRRAPRLLFEVPAGRHFEAAPGPGAVEMTRNRRGWWEGIVRLPSRAKGVSRFWNLGVQDPVTSRVTVVTVDLGP